MQSPRRHQEGMTLIEIMIVTVIIAMAAAGMSMGLGALTKSTLRSATVKLASVTKFAYHRALSHGTTVRLTLDFEAGTFSVTEAEGKVTLARSDDSVREEAIDDKDREDPGAAVDPWEAAKARLAQAESGSDELDFGSSPFGPITTKDGKAIKRYGGQPLGNKIRITKVIVAHEADPREEGVTDLFFFPGGMTQHAVIQLSDSTDTIYSVEIHPLTGQAKIHLVPYEPEVLFDDPEARDDEASEAEDR